MRLLKKLINFLKKIYLWIPNWLYALVGIIGIFIWGILGYQNTFNDRLNLVRIQLPEGVNYQVSISGRIYYTPSKQLSHVYLPHIEKNPLGEFQYSWKPLPIYLPLPYSNKKTSCSGICRFGNIPRGIYTLQVSHPDFQDFYSEIRIGTNTKTLITPPVEKKYSLFNFDESIFTTSTEEIITKYRRNQNGRSQKVYANFRGDVAWNEKQNTIYISSQNVFHSLLVKENILDIKSHPSRPEVILKTSTGIIHYNILDQEKIQTWEDLDADFSSTGSILHLRQENNKSKIYQGDTLLFSSSTYQNRIYRYGEDILVGNNNGFSVVR